MNFFKRRSHPTTVIVSDQTRTSHVSLSSGDGRSSQLGSTATLRKIDLEKAHEEAKEDYHHSETVAYEEHQVEHSSLIKSSSKLPRKRIKHAHFVDDSETSSLPYNGQENLQQDDRNYLLNAGKPRDMTLVGQPDPNLMKDVTSEFKKTPMSLYASVIKGDKAELKKIISANQDLLDTADNFGRTPLMYCVLADRLECAKFLIKRGCKLDQADNVGRSAIHSAAHKGSYKFLELLHQRGAHIDIKDSDGQTALHLATRNRNAKCLEFLLRHVGPGMVDVQDNKMRTALHWSAAFNNTECVKLLIKYGINIAIPDSDGKTPLHWAANNHDPSAVNTMAALLEKSPGVLNWQDYEGRTALHFAVANGNSAAVELLVKFKRREHFETYECDVNSPDNTFRTPLHWAAQLGHDHIVKILLDAKPGISTSDGNGATPFLYASLNNHYNVVKTMIEHDSSVLEQADINGRNALMWAAGKGANDVIRVILGIPRRSKGNDEKESADVEDGSSDKTRQWNQDQAEEQNQNTYWADINKTDNKANTALHVAAWNGHGSSVELLLSHGARHDLQNEKSCHTPIFGACEKGHLNVVKYLLDYNASISLVDSDCRSPLHWAALGGHAEVCELLIKEGLDVDIRDKFDRTPLHCAAFSGFINCMNLLLENGASVDLQDQEGLSALHWAAQSEHLDATKLLFQYAVFPNPMEYNEERLTPLDYALQKNREEVAQYLLDQGCLSAENIRNIAATKVQACFRGYQLRKSFLMRKHLLMKMLMLRKDKTRGKKRSEGQGSDDGSKKQKESSLSPRSAQSHLAPTSSIASDTTEDEEQKENFRPKVEDEEIKNLPESHEENPAENNHFNQESDSGIRMGENEDNSDKKSDSVEPQATNEATTANLSNDEGIICDHLSATSSPPSLKSAREEYQKSPAHSRPSSGPGKSPKVNATLPGPAADDSENTYPHEAQASSEKNIKRERKKMKKSRSKTRTDVPDSDSDYKVPSSIKRSPRCSPISLRSNASSIHKTPTNDRINQDVLYTPTPPITKSKKTKRRHLQHNRGLSPRFTSQQEYPALDRIGDENNIQSESVSGLAYRSHSKQLSLYADELPQVFPGPAVPTSSALDLSEYIESLMKLSDDDRKLLRAHQASRKEAFQAATNAAKVIQRAWWRYLSRKKPELRRKFRHARKKALKIEKAKKKKADKPDTVLPQEENPPTVKKKGSISSDSSDRRAKKTKPAQKKRMLPNISSDSTASIAQNQPPAGESCQSSIASASDVMSSADSDKSGKRRRPKTTTGPSQGNVYISVEKLEELSRIYGHPQAIRDLLSATETSSVPTLDLSVRQGGAKIRPVTVLGGNRQNRNKETNENGSRNNPSTSEQSPRQWASTSDRQKKTSPTKTATNRAQPMYRSGPPNDYTFSKAINNQNVDVTHLPLQWQKLSLNSDGELQNMAVADSQRKSAARFSYNLGDIGL